MGARIPRRKGLLARLRLCRAFRAPRRLCLALGLAALLGMAAVGWGEPPTAVAYDDSYYQWCKDAVGEAGYCCNKAGGVWTGGDCKDVQPSPGPTYFPPDNGFFFP